MPIRRYGHNMSHYYTDEKNTLILISLLKQHNIKKVIASPGATNVSFVGSIQSDPFFEIYSAVDERAAAFMACGLAEESGEPVVLTCTGATASRNYIPGLTEAFYRKLPILAVTSSQHEGRVGNYIPQVIDRRSQFLDLVKKSVQAQIVDSQEDEKNVVTMINDAILELNHNNPGPVHINLYTTYSNNFSVKELPQYRKINRIIDKEFPKIPKGNIGVFIGAHAVFTEEETSAIDAFCESNNAVVICDHISNYRGKYRFLASLLNNQHVDFGTKHFDLIIYIGYVHGTYMTFYGKELWRVNPDGVIRDPFYNLTNVFEMDELSFFKHYSSGTSNNTLKAICDNANEIVLRKIPELPFSNMWIAQQTAGKIPEGSALHFSILNTLRVWNFFETNKDVVCYANSGGFGIEGCLSSCIGSALVNKDKEHYMIIGDLAFFYDFTSLFNEIPSNIHIMVINNGVGTEFKNYNHRAAYFGEDANNFIAAKGHNGFKNKQLLREFCEKREIQYYSSSDKDSYLDIVSNWLKKNDRPVLLEVFTSDDNESIALKLMNNILVSNSKKARLKRIIKRILKK